MLAYLQLIRWKNILFIGITQLLLYYRFFQFKDQEISIQVIDVYLFILCTMIIAASGFVINNLFDLKSDFYNQKYKQTVIAVKISQNVAIRFYYILVAVGGIIAIYLSIKCGFYFSYLFYPISIYLFWLYSKFLKCSCIFGNLFVSVFISSVVLIMPYLFQENLRQYKLDHESEYYILRSKIIILAAFAFLANLLREIIKDIQDERGDRLADCKTTAVCLGIKNTRLLAKFILILMILFAVGLLFFKFGMSTSALISFVILPLFGLVYFLMIRKVQEYSLLSNLIKIYMLIGLCSLIFL